MLRDNLVGLIKPMQISAGTDPLALSIQKQASDDRSLCLENPRPEGAESSLTENVTSPFQAEPAQYHHVCFHQRLCPAIRKEKKNLHLDQRIRRRASGGHNKRASHTYVSCDAFALVASVSGPTPAEHYGCIQSIANVTSSFEGILGFMCDLSVSTFPGPTRTPPVSLRLWYSKIVNKWL